MQLCAINEPLFRLRRPVVTYKRHPSALRVSVGDTGRQVIWSCRSTLLGPRRQRSGEGRHQRRADVLHGEREVTVSAQPQVSATVSAVSSSTRQLWTAACSQCHRRPTRFVDNNLTSTLTYLLMNFMHTQTTCSCVSWLRAVVVKGVACVYCVFVLVFDEQ